MLYSVLQHITYYFFLALMTFLTLSTDNALNHNNGLDILRILIKLVSNLTYTLKIISPSEQIKRLDFLFVCVILVIIQKNYSTKIFIKRSYHIHLLKN